RMFGSEFIIIVEPGAKLVNGMLQRGPLDFRKECTLHPDQTVDLVLNHRKYKVLVGNVPLENSRNILEMYLYEDEWRNMMEELDFQPGHLFAFTLLRRGLFHLMIFNESGEAVIESETYLSYMLRNACFYVGRKPAS
ncbi:reverse transcriptase domain-containing protein, partial [Tanacetum coccineum]